MAEFDEQFAEAVLEYPVVYDKECKDFKDKNKKSQAWTKTVQIFNATASN
jgi:hypothetical protein